MAVGNLSAQEVEGLVKEDRVAASLYRDPAIFELEMERIFQHSWVWVAHESEIAEPNNFKMSWVGTQPVIVSRDREGRNRVLLNRCRHRGATVCEARQGKASVFVCPYHGWAYNLDGTLRKIPYASGYSETFDKTEMGLIALRTESHNGLIFATFDEDLMPLSEWLGPARKWLDLFLKQGAGFGVRTLGEHRYRYPGNWKIQLENTTDAYHFPIVHKTYLTSLDDETEDLMDVLGQGGWIEELGNGHSVMAMIPDLLDLDQAQDAPIPERFEAFAAELAAEGRGEAEIRRIVHAAGGVGFNLNLFPNLGCSLSIFRVLRPISVDETEIQHIAIGMNGGPESGNRLRRRLHERFGGPMGFGTPDDAEAWVRVQRGSRAGDDVWIMLNRGVAPPDEGPQPGHNASDVSSELGMRACYAMWKRMMSA